MRPSRESRRGTAWSSSSPRRGGGRVRRVERRARLQVHREGTATGPADDRAARRRSSARGGSLPASPIPTSSAPTRCARAVIPWWCSRPSPVRRWGTWSTVASAARSRGARRARSSAVLGARVPASKRGAAPGSQAVQRDLPGRSGQAHRPRDRASPGPRPAGGRHAGLHGAGASTRRRPLGGDGRLGPRCPAVPVGDPRRAVRRGRRGPRATTGGAGVHIPPPADAIARTVDACLEPAPRDRPTIAQMAAALREVAW